MKHKHLKYKLFTFILYFLFTVPIFSQTKPSETLNGTTNEIYEGTIKIYLEAQKILDSPKCLQMADKMTSMSKERDDIEGQLLAQIIREEHFLMTNRADSMISCIKQIERLAGPSSKYRYYYFRCRYWVSQLYIYRHHYAAALKEIDEYQKLALACNDVSGIGLGYKLVGDLLLSQKKSKSAMTQYERGYNYLHEHGSAPDEVVTALAMGKYYYNSGDYDKALQYLKRVGTHDYEENCMMDAYSSMAMCYMAKGDNKMADNCFKKVEAINATHTMYPQVSDVYNYVKLVRSFESTGHSEQTLHYSNLIHDPLLKLTINARMFYLSGNYKRAYELGLQRDAVRDSLEDLEEVQMLASYQSKFDYSVLVTEKERLKHENMSLELHDAKVKEALLWTTLISLFVLGGAYTLYRRKVLRRLNESKEKAEKAQQEAEIARQKAEKAKALAEQADKLKTYFLQNMSHEIRTPLNAIIGFNELLNNDEMNGDFSPEEKKDIVRMMQSNSELLLTLVNDILDLSKLESGTYKRVISEVNISKLCKTVLESVRSRVGAGVELILDCESDELELRTDALRLQQLLTNFLTNAAKYTSEGSIKLAFTVESGFVKFSVTDTGSGIPPEGRARIFNRFEKLDNFKQGTGLGLNICKCISDMLEGNIYLDVEYNDGARFVFEHPTNL